MTITSTHRSRLALLPWGACAALLGAWLGAGQAPPAQGPSKSLAPVTFTPNGQVLNNLIGRGVAVGDFNGDRKPDVFVVNEMGQGHDGRVYFGDGRGQFTDSGQRLEGATGARQPAVFDVDGNGSLDVIAGRAVWLNDGQGRFKLDTSRFQDADGAGFYQCRLADLNGDGRPDVFAVVMTKEGTVARVYLNDGKGSFREAGEALRMNLLSGIALGDVNGDGSLDAVVSGWRMKESDPCPNRVLLNDGKGRFTDTGQALDEAMRHSHGLALGDLDGDGDLDLVLVTQGKPSARLYLNDGKGRFAAGPTLGTTPVEKVAVADFNRDGKPDIFLACLGPDEVWLNEGKGQFSDSGLRLGQDWSWELAVADLNGDGLLDVFVTNLGVDRTAPPQRMMQPRPAEVWLNATRKPGR